MTIERILKRILNNLPDDAAYNLTRKINGIDSLSSLSFGSFSI